MGGDVTLAARLPAALTAWLRIVAATAVGIGLLSLAHVPSPSLFGGLLGALVISLSGTRSPVLPRPVYVVGQATVGLTAAAMVDMASLRAFAVYWFPISLVCLITLAASAGAGLILRLRGVSTVTAVFATIAGGASGMVALADDLGADSRVVTVVQYLRVLLILFMMPVVAGFVGAGGARARAPDASPRDYLFAVTAVALGIGVGYLARLPAPAIVGALVVGTAMVLTPPFQGSTVPMLVQGAGFTVIGVQVGLRFDRASLAALGRLLPLALATIVVIIAGCAVLGLLLARMTGESVLDAYLATTPGGLPAVLATSSGTSGNVTFVTATQVLRIVMVLLLAPIVTQIVRRLRR